MGVIDPRDASVVKRTNVNVTADALTPDNGRYIVVSSYEPRPHSGSRSGQ